MASYMGHMQWANAVRLKRSLFSKYPVLRSAFLMRGDIVIPRYLPGKKDAWFRYSYNWWIPDPHNTIYRRAKSENVPLLHPLWTSAGIESKVLVFFRVGRFYEFYGTQALLAHKVLGLKLVNWLHGFQTGCGFHGKWLHRFSRKAIDAGYHVALIREEKRVDGKVRRKMAALFRGKPGIRRLAGKKPPSVQLELPFL